MKHEDKVKRLLDVKSEQPGKCNQAVFDKGTEVLRLAGPRSWLIERYVVAARKQAGVDLDWFFAGGRAIVLTMPGDEDKAVAALNDWMPAFEEAAKLRASEDGGYEVQIMGWGRPRPPKPNELPPNALGFDPDTNQVFLGE